MFGSLEGEDCSGEESRGEWLSYLIWMVLKLSKGESKGKFGNSFGQIFLYSTHPPNLFNLGELKMRG